MSGLELKDAVARALKTKRPVLVHSPFLRAEKLSDDLERLTATGAVTVLDCRAACPSAPVLEERFAQGLSPGRVLHVLVQDEIPDALWGALVRVAADQRLPGRTSTSIPEGLLVLSAKTKFASDLNRDLGAHFPLQVGSFS